MTNDAVVLYLHVPKCGGQTFSSMLRRGFARERTIDLRVLGGSGLGPALDALPAGSLTSADLVMGHFPWGLHEHLTRPARHLTSLRDPVARVVSLYHYVRATPNHPLHEWVTTEHVTLLDYVASDMDRTQVENGQVRQLAGDMRRDPDTTSLDTAVDNLESCVVVGLTERFDETVVLVSRALDLPATWYERRNSRSQAAVAPPSEEALGIVRERNDLDLALHAAARERFARDVARHPDMDAAVQTVRRRSAVLGGMRARTRRARRAVRGLVRR